MRLEGACGEPGRERERGGTSREDRDGVYEVVGVAWVEEGGRGWREVESLH